MSMNGDDFPGMEDSPNEGQQAAPPAAAAAAARPVAGQPVVRRVSVTINLVGHSVADAALVSAQILRDFPGTTAMAGVVARTQLGGAFAPAGPSSGTSRFSPAGPSGFSMPGPSGFSTPGPSGFSTPGPSGMSMASTSGSSMASTSGMSMAGPSGSSMAGTSGLSMAGTSSGPAVSAVVEVWKCKICYLANPNRILRRCGHRVCLPCITEWLNINPKCPDPLCREPATTNDVIPLS